MNHTLRFYNVTVSATKNYIVPAECEAEAMADAEAEMVYDLNCDAEQFIIKAQKPSNCDLFAVAEKLKSKKEK